jgi:TP53 regulating kinase-like protein
MHFCAGDSIAIIFVFIFCCVLCVWLFFFSLAPRNRIFFLRTNERTTQTMDIDEKEEEEEERQTQREDAEMTTTTTSMITTTTTTTTGRGLGKSNDNNNGDDGVDQDLLILERIIATKTNDNNQKLRLLSQGAEARVFTTTFLGKPCVVKQRFKKKYRHPVLDQKLTRSRLLAECRSLMKARILGVQAPTVLFVDKPSASIFMERVEGKSLKEVLKSIAERESEEEEDEDNTRTKSSANDGTTASPSSPSSSSPAHLRAVKYGHEIGLIVSKLHDGNITHGDLTTSNFLVHARTDSVYIIDFGLSKTQIVGEEDIGVDLYVLERSLIAAHKSEGERVWRECLKTWKETCGKSKEAFKRYEEVRARGRKRSMVG